jgi:hypothetical protein
MRRPPRRRSPRRPGRTAVSGRPASRAARSSALTSTANRCRIRPMSAPSTTATTPRPGKLSPLMPSPRAIRSRAPRRGSSAGAARAAAPIGSDGPAPTRRAGRDQQRNHPRCVPGEQRQADEQGEDAQAAQGAPIPREGPDVAGHRAGAPQQREHRVVVAASACWSSPLPAAGRRRHPVPRSGRCGSSRHRTGRHLRRSSHRSTRDAGCRPSQQRPAAVMPGRGAGAAAAGRARCPPGPGPHRPGGPLEDSTAPAVAPA